MQNIQIVQVKYDVITFELRMYIPFEVSQFIPGYEYTRFYIPQPKKVKRKFKGVEKPPMTHYRVYEYRNKKTGNLVTMVESSRKERDDEHRTTYQSLRANFRSNASPVTSAEIMSFLEPILKQYKGIIAGTEHIVRENLKRINEQLKIEYDRKIIRDLYYERIEDEDVLRKCRAIYPWHIYYVEPCIDLTGDDIDFLYHNFMDNLYITRFKKKCSVSGGRRKTNDGRVMSMKYGTSYLSNRLRMYRFEKKNKHYLRLEWMLDKDYLRSQDIWTLHDMENFRVEEFWQKRCFFYDFDIEKIKRRDKQAGAFVEGQPMKPNGEMYTKWDKVLWLRKYTVDGKKIFRNVASKFTVKKWQNLHELIAEGLSQLSLNEVINCLPDTQELDEPHTTLFKSTPLNPDITTFTTIIQKSCSVDNVINEQTMTIPGTCNLYMDRRTAPTSLLLNVIKKKFTIQHHIRPPPLWQICQRWRT